MKRRNEALYEEAARIVALKRQIPLYKHIAERHGVSVQTVRAVISAMIRDKSTSVEIHVEH